MDFINSEYQDCIDFLNDCAQVCYECFEECLNAPDFIKRGELIKNLVECAHHCELTVGFLARKSVHSKEMALISAHLAKVTGEECEKFSDEHTKITGQVCLEAHEIIVETFSE